MKKILLLFVLTIGLKTIQAQKDSTRSKRDTINIGGMIIITKKDKKRQPNNAEKNSDSIYNNQRGYKKRNDYSKNVTTNWFAFDIGFNNYSDNTNYGSSSVTSILRKTNATAAPNASNFKLNTGKSIAVNLWIWQQKMNLIKHRLNLKYAVGIELNNYRFLTPITYKNTTPSYLIMDSVSFSKNKLVTNYLTVPLMLTLNPTGRNGFSLSAGVSAGYRYRAHTKQISDSRGKQKDFGDFDLNPWKVQLVGDIGYNYYRIFASYSLTKMHTNALDFTPYTVGFRFSKW